jgi:hypothetical protein
VQEGVLLPEHIDVATQTYSPGWRTVSDSDSFALDRKLRLFGWGFFFFAGELKTFSFGFSQDGILQGAVGRFLAKVRSLNFNSVEFTNIVRSRFFGIPCVSVHGHARHIQQNSLIDSAGERNRQQR